MFPETHLPFLQKKISELRSALFFSLGDSVLRMPTTIVTALKVDDVGQIWFLLNRPMQNIQEFDREFPARLEFCRKGKSFYLRILGKACLVNDPEELNGLVDVSEDIRAKAMDQLVLVKVKIQGAEYMEKNSPETSGWMHSIRAHFNKWFGNQEPHARPYSLQPAQ
jgi:hypothetical protein